MADVGQKIDDTGSIIASSVTLGVAIILSVARMFIKVSKFHRLHPDDWLFLFAVCSLVAGTAMVFLKLPYNQTEVNVGAGVEPPPPDFTHQLDFDVKFQDAASLLFSASISTLLPPSAGTHREAAAILVVHGHHYHSFCNRLYVYRSHRMSSIWRQNNGALKRQVAILYIVVTLDIFTDLLLRSIPVLLLWNVKINLYRKIGFGCLLCLSIFAIITNIIRAAGHKLNNGQSDVVWILFWGEMETCIAVMANSMTSFRSLFRVGLSKVRKSPGDLKNQSPLIETRLQNQRPHVDLPTMPKAALSGMRSLLHSDPFEDQDIDDPERTLRTSESWSGWSTEAKQSTDSWANKPGHLSY